MRSEDIAPWIKPADKPTVSAIWVSGFVAGTLTTMILAVLAYWLTR